MDSELIRVFLGDGVSRPISFWRSTSILLHIQGLGVMLGVYVAGDSGAYLNPAITFASCYYRGLPWRRFPMYFIAQLLGGFVAAGKSYMKTEIYRRVINPYRCHLRQLCQCNQRIRRTWTENSTSSSKSDRWHLLHLSTAFHDESQSILL
jgi:glycerol uptake facilitator-like aquaporin